MTGEKRTFRLGDRVRVTTSEELAEALGTDFRTALAETFGRRTTSRRSADRLSADRIVDVAIAQMREHGYEAVTMRSIARELGTGPASLYAHVASRAELDQLVLARVSGQLAVPDPDPEHWDEQVRSVLHDLLALYRSHPGVARCTLATIPTSPEALVTIERVLALLLAGGLPHRHAAWFADVATLYVAATAMEEDLWRQRAKDAPGASTSEPEVVANMANVFAALPREHFPSIALLSGVLTEGDSGDRFAFGVDLLIEGLRAQAR